MFDDTFENEPGEARQLRMPWAARRPLVTWTLLLLNVVVWLVATAAGGTEDRQVLLDFGAMFGPLIASGEYWRLFTAMFLHVGIAHLAFNCLALFIFGPLVEGAYGHARFLTIYVIAGLSGSVASYLLNSIAVGAGASGAIFGVLGALAAFFVAQRRMFGSMARRNLLGVLVLAGINLVYGFTTPGIDNVAHLGGFVAGIVLGLALAPRYTMVVSPSGAGVVATDTKPLAGRWWVVPVAGAVLVLGASLATATLPENGYTHLYRAEDHFAAAEYDLALAEADTAILLDRLLVEAYYVKARTRAVVGDDSAAIRELHRLFAAVEIADRSDSGRRKTLAEAVELLQRLRSGR